MKKNRKLKAISVCIILCFAYFWNYGLTHPQTLTDIVSGKIFTPEAIQFNNFSVQVGKILMYIFKL